GIYLENLILDDAAGTVSGTGNSLANVITGNAYSNSLSGNAGADTIHGGADDDTLTGGTGSDIMDGGPGHDPYYVDSTGDQVTENEGEGDSDWVYSDVSFTLGSYLENLQLVAADASDRNGYGNSLSNQISGDSSNNILDGSTGADTLTGALGDDTY